MSQAAWYGKGVALGVKEDLGSMVEKAPFDGATRIVIRMGGR